MESIAVTNTVLLLGAILIVIGILSSLIATRFGAPLLLIFLIIGMLAGEDGPGGLPFEDYRLTYLIGSLALAIILFDGGLRTRFAAIRGALAPSLLLATAGVVITAALVALVAIPLLGLTWLEGLLLGAIVASTDAAAVFFLLRTGGLRLKQRVAATLEVESGTNDPVAVFLTVVLVELIVAKPAGAGWAVAGMLAQQGLLGAALGLSGGLAASWLLNRVQLPSGLHPLFVVASAVLVFAAAAVADGSGFLAVYLAGLVVGNRPIRAYASVISFHDTATWLCQIVMFLVLGLLVTPSRLLDTALPALGIAMFLLVVGRPVAVWLCLTPFRFTPREKLFVSWVGLRGAVSIFLAAIPVLVGVRNGDLYFNVAFFVVLLSLLLQGWTIRGAALGLGLAQLQSAAPIQRIELDLPGQLGYEMVGYPVHADSLILVRGGTPDWARLVLVVRNDSILEPSAAGALKSGDYAYFLAPPRWVARLDRLFAPAAEAERDRALFAEFILIGDAPIARVAELYSLDLAEEERELTVAQYAARRSEGPPQIGDRIPIGAGVLVVRALDGGMVVRAGLQLESIAAATADEPSRRARLAAALRAAVAEFTRRRKREPAAAQPPSADAADEKRVINFPPR